ncbi:MAG: FAD-binding oxidoreductase [Cytophagales bacterium]|nr:MAG: FAD-binding oxidoreductase [Cytophagales bacterium]
MKIANWGNYPMVEGNITSLEFEDEIRHYAAQQHSFTIRGNGRSYGDSSLDTHIFSTLKFNKILSFDTEKGIICCQSGVLLSEILALIVPRGFFLPVTPGTKFITVGGAIGADVHGKNHHKDGCFSAHLIDFELLNANNEIIKCSKTENADLFWLTCGGMGLTGIILSATFGLKKIATAYIRQESIKARNLDEIMDLFEDSQDWTYTMAWLDCLQKGKSLGRSVMMRGEHAEIEEISEQKKARPLALDIKPKLAIPFYFPNFALNTFSVKSFNFLYYHKQFTKQSNQIIPYEPFFYPLDAIYHWNRMYGKNGFTQYQFVLPKESSKEGLEHILRRISKSGQGSFLVVLKLFGKANLLSPLSFPIEGYTLALDFKIQKGIFELLDELDKIVLDLGGRLYLAKDARMKANFFLQTYQLDKQNINKHFSRSKFDSLQAKRLLD